MHIKRRFVVLFILTGLWLTSLTHVVITTRETIPPVFPPQPIGWMDLTFLLGSTILASIYSLWLGLSYLRDYRKISSQTISSEEKSIEDIVPINNRFQLAKKKRIILVFTLFFLVFLPSTYAYVFQQSTQSITQTIINVLQITYVPITITNSQTSSTPNPFQQRITWNPSTYSSYEASNLGNIRFYSDSSCTTPLHAWLESCTPTLSNTATSATAWVKLTTPISGSGGTLTIYMAFQPTSTSYDGNYWGNSPNLSPTYGQYDNGANVFNFYDDFMGTSLSAKWTQILGSSGASITVNNGLTVRTTSTASTAYGFVISATQTYPQVAETYTSNGNSILGVSTTQSLNGFIAPYTGYSMDWYAGYDDIEYEASSGSTQLRSITQSTFPAGIWQVTWSARASQYFMDGAGNAYTSTYYGASIANYRIYVGQSNGIVSSSVFRWARMRAFPPSNVMPSVSFGSLIIS